MMMLTPWWCEYCYDCGGDGCASHREAFPYSLSTSTGQVTQVNSKGNEFKVIFNKTAVECIIPGMDTIDDAYFRQCLEVNKIDKVMVAKFYTSFSHNVCNTSKYCSENVLYRCICRESPHITVSPDLGSSSSRSSNIFHSF